MARSEQPPDILDEDSIPEHEEPTAISSLQIEGVLHALVPLDDVPYTDSWLVSRARKMWANRRASHAEKRIWQTFGHVALQPTDEAGKPKMEN